MNAKTMTLPAVPDEEGDCPETLQLEPRLDWFKSRFAGCSDAVFYSFILSGGVACALIYIREMFDYRDVEAHLLKPLMAFDGEWDGDIARLISERRIPMAGCKALADPGESVNWILEGFGVLLFDGSLQMLGLPFSKFEKRALEEAPNESVIRGPREAFVESLDTNLTLLRRRIRSSHLKTEQLVLGRNTRTAVVIVYLNHVCPPALVQEMKRRISCIDIDGILGSNYIEEAIEDSPSSPFPQLQYTERPDTVSASVLEGRVAVVVDNTPIVLLAPVNFFMMLQSAEDYYQPFIAASWIRWIRLAFLITSLLLPSFYIAITTFHPEMIPFDLLISVSSSREVVPFPALMEALMMEVAFEALREASVRIPKSIGQAVSIIGALIIGTAAVQAGIVSAAMVIIVSLTGIASFIIPNFDLGLSFRLLRFPMMLLAGAFGIFGIACGLIIIYVHMLNLESFGMPYLSPLTPQITNAIKDTFIRAPWWKMRKRPPTAIGANRIRQTAGARAWAQSKGEGED
ncbi:spore germination protein [Cohnella sp. GCM10012308]|uniref:spore germination protein n=1 Tax=Cohnella sp. GCM10012308 TaxID=3317329 RepID=UPI003619FCCE